MTPTFHRATAALLAVFLVSISVGRGQESGDAPVIESEGPAQLLERGRAAFARSDFETAEQALEKFIVDYGEAEEVKEREMRRTK